MPGDTNIEWADKVWNPVTGCTPISDGCKNCYAAALFKRFKWHDFNEVTFHPDRLDAPLHWKKPRRVFVNSMGDLFHKDVEWDWIHKILNIIHDCRLHTFIILTKRPKQMKNFFNMAYRDFGMVIPNNLQLGVSVESKKHLNRMRILREIPLTTMEAVPFRFVSAEPLLESLLYEPSPENLYFDQEIEEMDWVVAGGETGTSARPHKNKWIEELGELCKELHKPFFDKRDPATPGFAGRRWG